MAGVFLLIIVFLIAHVGITIVSLKEYENALQNNVK